MITSREEVLDDLDETLDKLIENAKTLKAIEARKGFETECEALQKTQESLLARLTYRKERVCERKREEVSKRMNQLFSKEYSSRPAYHTVRISKRRQRSKLGKATKR